MTACRRRAVRLALPVLILTFFAGILAGCRERQPEGPKQIRIGVTYYDAGDTFLNALTEYMKSYVKTLETGDLEIALILKAAGNVQRTQDDQVRELLDAGCEVICVNLVDRTAPSEIIDEARDRDVPLIFFNREPVKEDMMQWDQIYYVGADAVQSGQLQGELAADAAAEGTLDRNHDGVIRYVVLEGEPGHQDAIVRTESSVSTIKSAGIEMEKLSYQVANWNRAQAQNRMEQMIGRFHNEIELVLANNDDMALGAADAYRKLNVTENNIPAIYGVDGTEVGLDGVENGILAGTVYNDKEGQAKAMADLAVMLALEEPVSSLPFTGERMIYLAYEKVTKENCAAFRDKGSN